MFNVNWQGGLSRSSQDAAMDAAEYAWPKTIEGCWKQLKTMLIRGRITQATYNEINEIVSFEPIFEPVEENSEISDPVKPSDKSTEQPEPNQHNAEKFYSMELEMPKNAQEGITNFVQMIINQIEAGNTQEALLKAVDLKNDLECEIYKVTMNSESNEPNIDTHGINQR